MRGVEVEVISPQLMESPNIPPVGEAPMIDAYFHTMNGPIGPRHAKSKAKRLSAEEYRKEVLRQKAQEEGQQMQEQSDRLDRLENMMGQLATAIQTLASQGATAAPVQTTAENSVAAPEARLTVPAQPALTSPAAESTPPSLPASTSMGLSGVPGEEPGVPAMTAKTSMETSQEAPSMKSYPKRSKASTPAEHPKSDDAGWGQEGAEDLIQSRVQSTLRFLGGRDPHRWFRGVLTESVHRQVSYGNWPRDMQSRFDEKFGELLQNERLFRSLVKTVLRMQGGEAIGDKALASLSTIVAGVVAFYMSMESAD